MTNANNRQPGGDHYKKRPIQHWDFVAGHDYGYLAGQVTKYLFRWRDKGGDLDLEKSEHFLDKLIEIERQHEDEGFVAPTMGDFIHKNQIPEDEAFVMLLVHAFHETRNVEYLELAKLRLGRLRRTVPHAPA